jgi:PBP1b-binding outer membrane lipoprotein LpoB
MIIKSVASVVAMALLLTGCGGSDSGTNADAHPDPGSTGHPAQRFRCAEHRSGQSARLPAGQFAGLL